MFRLALAEVLAQESLVPAADLVRLEALRINPARQWMSGRGDVSHPFAPSVVLVLYLSIKRVGLVR